MGIWGYICSTSDSLRRNTPDLTAVKDWCSSSHSFGLVAVTKINNVRINATQTLIQSLSDEETQSRVAQEAADLAKRAAVYGSEEVLKFIPGGPLIYKIVSRSICHKKNSSKKCRQRAQAKATKLEESDDEKSEDLESAEKDEACADLKTKSATYLKSKL